MTSRDPSRDEAFTQKLLEAGRAERPSAEGKGAALTAIERGDEPREAPPAGKPWTQWARLGIGAAILLGLGLFGLEASRRQEDAPVAATPQQPPPQAIVPPATPQPAAEPIAPPSPVVEPAVAPPVATPPRPPLLKRSVSAPKEEDDDALERELALLEKAREKLKTSPAASLATLEAHAAKFPHGALKQEATLLRIEVLVKLGRRAEAEALAQQLSAGASAILLQRIHTLLSAP